MSEHHRKTKRRKVSFIRVVSLVIGIAVGIGLPTYAIARSMSSTLNFIIVSDEVEKVVVNAVVGPGESGVADEADTTGNGGAVPSKADTDRSAGANPGQGGERVPSMINVRKIE